VSQLIFRRGLDLKDAVAGDLARDYHSDLVAKIKANDYVWRDGRLAVHLAREFGFCYGVERAVDYAYQARKRFADRRVFLTGEIIHNPHVNEKLRESGIRFLSDPTEQSESLGEGDVVILPAFGVTIAMMQALQTQGCTLVDTTCGSVLNVWKNVHRYAADGFTSIIHGKARHEETQATASQATRGPGGRYLVVLDREQAERVCDFIRHGGDAVAFLHAFQGCMSPAFDPMTDLSRVGLANQTTMLMSESLEIARMFEAAMRDRYGEAALSAHFRSFDTICSATQERQDAVVTLLSEQALDLMLVVGGYNSSNTCNLARICNGEVPTYHIADPSCLMSASQVRHRPVPPEGASAKVAEITRRDWLPNGPVTVGLTAGASTPNNIIGQVVERLQSFLA
jgi:4-hydroxy-3-methylbut-2-enyl diphosphate reductase